MNPQVSNLIHQAIQHFQGGRLAEVEISLKRALQIQPDHFNALHILGGALAQQGRLQESAEVLLKATRINPSNPSANYDLANILMLLNEHEKALEFHEKAGRLDPNGYWVHTNHGISLSKLNRHDEAIHKYRRAVAINPQLPQGWSNLGNCCKELKRYDEALTCYDHALQLKADYAEAWFNKGVALSQLKRHGEALTHYDQAIRLRPDYAAAWSSKGVTLSQLKRHDEALAHYDQAIQIKADYAEAWSNKGVTLSDLRRHDQALAHYDQAIRLKPDYAQAWSGKGVTLSDLKRHDEALAHHDQAIRLKPDYAEAWSGKGVTLSELNRHHEALAHYDRAIQLKPDYAEAWSNKGNTLSNLKRFEEALAHYDQAIQLDPDYAEAWSNKGNALSNIKHDHEALAHYDRAIQLKPDYAEAWSNKGNVLGNLKRHDEALLHYDKALGIDPDLSFLHGSRLHTKMLVCNWNNVESETQALFQKIRDGEKVTIPYAVLGLSDDPEMQFSVAKLWIHDRAPANSVLGEIPKRPRHEKIRIAYLSADFREHAAGYNFVGLFEHLDRTRFETFAISFSGAPPSEIRTRLIRAFDRFIDVEHKGDREVVSLMRDLEIDIAVDIMGSTQLAREGIFALRAAPIQVNQFGWTSSAPYMDYLISDEITIPRTHLPFYSEKVAYIPHTFFPTDNKRQVASQTPSRAEAGLPESAVVFSSFNTSYKTTPEVFSVWMRILKATGESVLWLRENSSTMVGNLRREAEQRGINPDRLIFAPSIKHMGDHLARYRLADLFLDTFPFTAQTTSVDALWAGLPVLTRMGESAMSRLAGSILYAVGLPELVTTSADDYERLAIELASQPERLAKFRQQLDENRLSKPLFDTARYTRHIEDAFTQMYERYHSGLAPEHIFVQST